MPECGIDGDAHVLAIEACPQLAPRPGPNYQVVTGTFRHQNARVIDVMVAREPAPIGATGNHPFWSEDRQKFVRADQLRHGETVRTVAGLSHVEWTKDRPGQHTVHNLEVQIDHTYHVAANGVLVHNTGLLCTAAQWESLVGRYLNRRGYDVLGSIRNASGHGVDVVIRSRRTGEVLVAEIKGAANCWGSLSERQARGANWFAQNVVGRFLGGRGHWAPRNVQPGPSRTKTRFAKNHGNFSSPSDSRLHQADACLTAITRQSSVSPTG